ncbi:Piezo-type mechanosensitive ion channel homolog [Arabidopsis thaliana] [Rhizoctonia solani]|uniref:Piezo-type mechanosensitive ion channel homolog [Arabidopsis thaliana] n=1 Tax=Rhizoctonia solani TaxID=456999 RepID=A0A0K6FNA8_9AGAM|nr:Piezo-type mechanosensitive ion channel homolog [Arabidopsis thaliana] [Rhizoctonia solani]
MSKVARVSLGELPNEVILRILHYCTFRSILCYATTNRRGYNLVKNSVTLQLKIELEVAGLEMDEFASDATTLCLLQDLKRYRDAWSEMKLSPVIDLPMPKDRILLWELREGSFISAYSTLNGKLADAIQLIPLDSQELPKPIKFEFVFHEFTVDLSQKLVVLAVYSQDGVRIIFRSSETVSPHPLAQEPIITILLSFPITYREADSITLEVMGDILVTKFADIKSLSYEVLIWNWKTATLLNRISSRNGVCDLGFLDRQHLILYHAASSDDSTALRAVSLRVYRDFLSPIENRDIHPDSDTYVIVDNHTNLDYTFSFIFPEIHPKMAILPSSLALRSDPIPGRLVHKTGSARLISTRAGTIGLIFPLSYDTRIQPQDVTYRIFVSTSRLFDLMNNHSETKTFEWSMWGEHNTRWFSDDNHQADWISWVSGSRYLRSSPGMGYSTLTLSILDFCPFSVKRHSEPHPDQIASSTQPLKGRNANVEQRWARTLRDWWNSPDWSNSDQRVFVDVVGSDIPTIVEVGLQNSVTSRLGWRSVTMAKVVPTKVWLIEGGHVIGKDVSVRPFEWISET